MTEDIKTRQVRFSESSWVGNQVLTCPDCGFDYLHQGAVRTYGRAEDEETTLVTTVDEQGSTTAPVPSRSTRNPSDRRHGLAISFGCEGCGQLFELTFAQHKGVTFVEWRPGRVAAVAPGAIKDELSNEVFFPPLADEPKAH